MDIPPVGLLESALDRSNSCGDGFGEVVEFSPEVNVPIKYTPNRSKHIHLNQVLLKMTISIYHTLILKAEQ